MLRRRSVRRRRPRERARPPRARDVRQHRDGIADTKSPTPFLCRALVHLQRPRDPIGRHAIRHHQQRATSQVHALLNFRPTQQRLDVLTLLRRERDRHRRATARRAVRLLDESSHASTNASRGRRWKDRRASALSIEATKCATNDMELPEHRSHLGRRELAGR